MCLNLCLFFQAFSNLSWVARDIAGDIRTAAVGEHEPVNLFQTTLKPVPLDFRHVIMGTLEDTQTKNDAKVTLLDNWCKVRSHSLPRTAYSHLS